MSENLQLFGENAEETNRVTNDLLNIGCCPRCILRFLGEKHPSIYKHSQEELFEKYIRTAGKIPLLLEPERVQTCPSCLGILQQFACDSFYHQVLQKVQEENFEFSGYQFSLTLPVCTILRQNAVYIYLLGKYEAIYKGKKEEIPSLKDVWKWCAGPCFSALLGVQFQTRSVFDILLNISYKNSNEECKFLLDVFPDIFRKRKVKKFSFEVFTRSNVSKATEEMSHIDFSKQFACPPSIPRESCTWEVTASHDSVFVAGRYQKFSRILSQTPWMVDGVYKLEGSVQEHVCNVLLKQFRPTDHKFSSSGREDVDVRMLGLGRPFVVEMINPHRVKFTQTDMTQMQKETNALTTDVAIRDLQIVTREDVTHLKEGEADKSKTYTAVCWCQRLLNEDDLLMISSLKNLTLQQKTPIRVLHRRAVATRERVIFSLCALPLSGHQFKLCLTTQAGTYVKEFVHGDFGRTQPNMCTLLHADCDILELDVEAVDIDWPPKIDPVPCLEETKVKKNYSIEGHTEL